MTYAEVGLGDLIWTALWVFFLVTFVWVFIAVVNDLFRDHTLSGGAKALWVVALIVLPVLGSLIYLVVRGEGMTRRAMAREQQAREAMDSYVRTTAGTSGTGPVDDLSRLAELRSNGALSDEEYEKVKRRIVHGAGV